VRRRIAQVRDSYGGPAALRADRGFADILQLWSRKAKLSNMHVERLLALIKSSVGTNRPSCEKLLAAGLLSPVLRDHVAAGGRDPRAVLRGDLIADGMPIESAQGKRLHVRPQMARGSLAYQNHRAAELRAAELRSGAGQNTPFAEHRQLRAGWAAEFREMSDEEQRRWENTSYAAAQATATTRVACSDVDNPSGLSLKDVNFGVGHGDLPISEEVATRIVCGVIGREPAGFNSYGQQFQDKLRDDLLVRDQGPPE